MGGPLVPRRKQYGQTFLKTRLLFKLMYIKFYTAIFYPIRGRRKEIRFFLTIDTECRFKDKVFVDRNSYPHDVYRASLALAELGERFGIPVTYFVDAAEIDLFRGHRDSIESLLTELVRRGHNIQLHLHPALNNPEQDPDLSSYSPRRVREMIEVGRDQISQITGTSPIAFRAGGYSIGDWPKIHDALVNAGIHIDSSTFSGAANLHRATFDFAGFENMMPYLTQTSTLAPSTDGVVMEFPITTAVRCWNNVGAAYFRFDPNRPADLLAWFTYFLCAKHPTVYINMIYHSKQVFTPDGSFTDSFQNLKEYLAFLARRGFAPGRWEDLSPLDCTTQTGRQLGK